MPTRNRTQGVVEDIGELMGASEAASTQRLAVYIPTLDRAGKAIPDRGAWLDEAMKLLAKIGGGATAIPCDGIWYETMAREHTDVIFTFIKPELYQANKMELREFLHRLGRETNQGEVAFEMDGKFFRITKYDPPLEHGEKSK